MDLRIQHHTSLDDAVLETLEALDQAIFPEPLSKQAFQRELQERRHLTILIARSGSELCGYKVGFEYSPDVFYSLSGGVLPAYRKRGVASALMAEQHRLVSELGYAMVRTHTKNRYRDMLILNIKAGFNITGVNQKSGEKYQTIILEKVLTPTPSPPAG